MANVDERAIECERMEVTMESCALQNIAAISIISCPAT